MSAPAGTPAADDAVPVAADGEEEFVFGVGCRTLLLSAIALIYALAVAGDPTPPVPTCHLLLLFLLWTIALGLVHASVALRGFPRGAAAAAAMAVARALHRLFWEQRQ